MEDNSRIPMGKTRKIIRSSIYIFLQNYQFFTTIAATIALPFSASILVSQAFIIPSSSSLISTTYDRLNNLFEAAGFPSTEFFNVLSFKISQTISSSIFTLPFTITFLLLAKSSVFQFLNRHKSNSTPTFSSVFSLYTPLLSTFAFNIFFLVSANASAFAILFLVFDFIKGFEVLDSVLLLSATSAVVYSVFLANSLVISNFALVLSGVERSGGYLAFLKACVVMRGRTSMALVLALPVNLGLAGIEALFQYRVVKAYYSSEEGSLCWIVLEAILIAYLYAVFLVLDAIVGFVFYKFCKEKFSIDYREDVLFCYRINIADDEARKTEQCFVKSKSFDENVMR